MGKIPGSPQDGGRREALVVAEDRPLHRFQLRAGFDAKVVVQLLAGKVVDGECSACRPDR
jgi:hypothetical protein